MLKVIFKEPIEILQDGLKAIAKFHITESVEVDNSLFVFDGNIVDSSLIEVITTVSF